MRTKKSYIQLHITPSHEWKEVHDRSNMGSIEESLEGIQDCEGAEDRKSVV